MQLHRIFGRRPGFDEKHELGALVATVNHRRGEFRLRRDETYLCGNWRGAAVTGYAHLLAYPYGPEAAFVDEEAHFHVLRRQQRHHGLVGIDPLAGDVVSVLYDARNRRPDGFLRELPFRLFQRRSCRFHVVLRRLDLVRTGREPCGRQLCSKLGDALGVARVGCAHLVETLLRNEILLDELLTPLELGLRRVDTRFGWPQLG